MRHRTPTAPPSALTPTVVADARALALEVAGLQQTARIDPSAFGLVTEPGERLLRVTSLWVRWLVDGVWSQALGSECLLTDRRLVARLPTAGLTSFWWGSLAGLDVDLHAGHVILDYGDGRPRALSGEGVALAAVAAVAAAYGVEALATHHAIEPLRS
jgi:hypothetical protein